MSGHREVLETWFRRVWAEEDAGAIDEMMAPGTPARGLGSQTHIGPAGFKGFQQGLLALVSDVEIKIDKSMEDGDWIFALVHFRRSAAKVANR
ncbi:MAG: nuclear transport factor 2 family protein [Paracoccaceae bacterium]